MFRDWPFFRSVLSNMDMVLAKSDLAIASRYAELVATRGCAQHMFGRLADEWQRTREWLARDLRQGELLADNPPLARSHPRPLPLTSIPSTICRSSCCAATAPVTATAATARDPSHHQRPRRRPAQQR